MLSWKNKGWKLGKNLTRIIGHPGTGKTTKLANLVLELIRTYGLEYCQNCVLGVSFSRAAAWALKERLKGYGVNIDNLHYFKTIHSLAANALELNNKSKFVLPEDAKQFMERMNISYNAHVQNMDDIQLYGYIGELNTTTPGNAILSYFQYLKRILLDEDKVRRAVEFHRDVPYMMERILFKYPGSYLLFLYNEWEKWKGSEGKYEYEDMLCEIVERKIGILGKITHGIVDEAQDLTPLQYAVLYQWLRDTEQVYVAGDEMQTLYAYLGASPEHLIRLEADRKWILDQSYRVPQVPWRYAKDIAKSNGCFTVDFVKPKQEEGNVLFITEEKALEIIQKPSHGTFFILFRSNREVFRFLDSCIAYGFLPHGLGRIATRASDILFVWRFELIRKLYLNQPLKYEEVRAMIISLPAYYLKRGVKTAFKNGQIEFPKKSGLITAEHDTHAQFYSLFKSIRSVQELKEVISDPKVILDRYERGGYKKRQLLKITPATPSLRRVNTWVGTYHSSKGLECDNAILFDYLPPKKANLENERCLIFTGLTRTKNVDFLVPVKGYRGFIEKNLQWRGGIEWWKG